MRQREKARKKYDRVQSYFYQPEFKKYKRRSLEDKTLMPFLIQMYNSLDERILKTKLIEAPEKMHHSHKVRENENTNPGWFRYFCSQYLEERVSKRKGSKKRNRGEKYTDTKIQAIHTQRALRNLIKNGYSHSKYFEDYIGIAKELKEQFILENKLLEEGENDQYISSECGWIRDLRGVSWEINPRENLTVAEGFGGINPFEDLFKESYPPSKETELFQPF